MYNKKSMHVLIISLGSFFGLLASVNKNNEQPSVFEQPCYQSLAGKILTFEDLYKAAQPTFEADQQRIYRWVEQECVLLDFVKKNRNRNKLESAGVQVLRCMSMIDGPILYDHTSSSSRTLCRIKVVPERTQVSSFIRKKPDPSYVCAAFVANTLLVQELIEKYHAPLHVPKSYLIKRDPTAGLDDSNVFVIQEYVPNFSTLTNRYTEILEQLTEQDILALYLVIKESAALWDIQRNLGWDGQRFWCVDLEPRGMTSEILFFNKHSGMVKNNVSTGLRQLLWFFQKMPTQKEYVKQLLLQDPDFTQTEKIRYTKA